MDYCQYKFPCMSCGSEIIIVSQEVNPIICQCSGCTRVIVIQGDTLYTVSRAFFDSISDQYKLKSCGQVIDTIIHRQDLENSNHSDDGPYKSSAEKKSISSDDIEELRLFLEESGDSSEIIKKYW